MARVLLVGAGLTSAVTGALIRRKVPQVQLVLWDKSRGAGGRMSTSRSPHDPGCTVDLGAQYISATPEYAQLHAPYYAELVGGGVLAPLGSKVVGMRGGEDTRHYVTPTGTSSIVKFYMSQAGVEARYDYHVRSVERGEEGRWCVRTQGGTEDMFDAVVLTMPVPQLLALSGDVRDIIAGDPKLLSNLESVDYSSRYALGLFYEPGVTVQLSDPTAAAEYISSDPVLRFVAIDNHKRGAETAPTSVVVHTSVPFGKVHVEETPDQVKPRLLASVAEMFPDWPQPSAVKCQKWRFSQVTSAFPGLPGCVALAGGLVVGGDGFTHSNMDGCIESAEAVAATVVKYIMGEC